MSATSSKGLIQALGVALVLATNASAVTFNFDNAFSYQGNAPQGAAPWLSVSFADTASNQVTLTVTALNLGSMASPEFLSELDLNFNSNATYNVQNLEFSFLSGTSGGNAVSTSPSPTLGENAYHADGDGLYDIQFTFGNNAFGPGDYLKYQINTTGSSLADSDFAYLSTSQGNNSGPFYAAAHLIGGVQGGGNGNFSAWIAPTGVPEPSPEPSSVALWTLLAATWAGFSRFRSRWPKG